jgi:DNA gyrase/topoisomerase IV subunit A
MQFVLSLAFIMLLTTRAFLNLPRSLSRFMISSQSSKSAKKKVSNVLPRISASASGIQNIELNDELKNSFMSYAMSTILSRALPDARDGQKPVHRRVLYAMNMLNLGPDSAFRKSARIVGEVLGKYHPHGDQSVYDALVIILELL